jgi:pimeloyl-ACP methyl ester carboxylesterase
MVGACLWIAAGCGHGAAGRAAGPTPTAPSVPGSSPMAPAAPLLDGAWMGTLHLRGGDLRLVVKIRREGSGWAATVDSIDQHARDIPIDTVAFDGTALALRSSRLNASFDGRLVGDTLSGTFRQRGLELPLVLARTSKPPVVKARPQQPIPPLPYDEVPLVAAGPPGAPRLACTLTKPRGPGRFPAVALITGSGPQNRDEALAGHRPFLVLADALTRRGVAVLRCDDRGVGLSTGDFATATTFDFADDALAEVAALRGRDDVDPTRLGLLGHSEGAIIAPIAAARSTDVKFVVLLAPPAVPGEQTLHLQTAAIAKASGNTDAQIAAGAAVNREVFAIVAAAPDGGTAAKELRARYAALPKAAREAFEQHPGGADAVIKQVTSPWFRTFLTLDPRVYLRKLAVPVLAVVGERDLQVLPAANVPELRQALRDNADVTIRELPGLNHLFQTCKTGLPDEYARIDETMSPALLTLVGEWIEQRAR